MGQNFQGPRKKRKTKVIKDFKTTQQRIKSSLGPPSEPRVLGAPLYRPHTQDAGPKAEKWKNSRGGAVSGGRGVTFENKL